LREIARLNFNERRMRRIADQRAARSLRGASVVLRGSPASCRRLSTKERRTPRWRRSALDGVAPLSMAPLVSRCRRSFLDGAALSCAIADSRQQHCTLLESAARSSMAPLFRPRSSRFERKSCSFLEGAARSCAVAALREKGCVFLDGAARSSMALAVRAQTLIFVKRAAPFSMALLLRARMRDLDRRAARSSMAPLISRLCRSSLGGAAHLWMALLISGWRCSSDLHDERAVLRRRPCARSTGRSASAALGATRA
jgi:hypothetical protein